MILRRVYSFIFCLLVFSSQVFSELYFRTSADSKSSSDVVFVSIDFKLAHGEHITSPSGKGKSLAPKCSWQNAVVLETFWPDDKELLNSDNSQSGYRGYTRDFSLVYKLKIDDPEKPVIYDLFYVKCTEDACIPCDKSGELVFNGELPDLEIPGDQSSSNIFAVILFGILGGLVLNFMPCVFPIISIKVFSILKSANLSKAKISKQSISFSAGVIATFLMLGSTLLSIKSTFPEIGWGFFMQSPTFVFLLFVVFFFSALHFWDVYTFQGLDLRNRSYLPKSVYVSAFLNGMLVALTSSSCVGPFSGVALAGALLQDNVVQSLSVFFALGFGLALPFLIIAIFPQFIHKMPKPGNWLNTFKKFMGFAMLFSCLWPISILLSQISHSQILALLAIIFTLSLLLYFAKHLNNSRLRIILLLGAAIAIFEGVRITYNDSYIGDAEVIEWRDYSEDLFNQAKQENTPIFLNFTASWCMNCQFNQNVFSDPEVIRAFREKKVLAIKCDWTKRSEKITQLLKKYNSVAVPLSVYYPAGSDKFEVLPSILTKASVLSYINGENNE